MGQAAPAWAPAALEEPQCTLELGKPLQLPRFPPGTSLGGQEHYTAQEAFTLDGGPTPPHTPKPVGPPTYLPYWGPTLYPAGWEDQSLSQGIAPRGGTGRRGRAGERGQPQPSPALLTKPCYCGPCPRAWCLEPPPPHPGGFLGPGLSGCLPTAPAKVGASASGSNEAK